MGGGVSSVPRRQHETLVEGKGTYKGDMVVSLGLPHTVNCPWELWPTLSLTILPQALGTFIARNSSLACHLEQET